MVLRQIERPHYHGHRAYPCAPPEHQRLGAESGESQMPDLHGLATSDAQAAAGRGKRRRRAA
jgi:hypothetical protein